MRYVAFCAAAVALFGATIAPAQTTALLIGNEDYERLPDVRRGDRLPNATSHLNKSGVQVLAKRDVALREMQPLLAEFGQAAGQSDALLVALVGRFFHTQAETYFLPTDAEVGPLASLHNDALPLSTVFGWLAKRPEKAVLVLGTNSSMSGPVTPFVNAGIGKLDIPEGVSVISGSARRAINFVAFSLPKPDAPFVPAARQGKLRVDGFAPNDLVFIESVDEPVATSDPLADIRAWRAADFVNTVESYESYINNHPGGKFVSMAQNRIQSLIDTPEARAERTEQALDLSRDERRDIQRDLSLLKYNTRGIDGIFGRGTRAALSTWQRDKGFDDTGYLTREQITRLNAQAERRAVELQAEAEQRQREQLARDRAFWDETGARGDEVGLRTYLNRFPDGEYAESANALLQQIEGQKRQRSNTRDTQYWDYARNLDTVEGYRDYLTDIPNGVYENEARARVEQLLAAQENARTNSRAARQEQALNLSPRARRLVESRLAKLGLKPGRVDGTFDNDTRRALRRYQTARNLEATGYLSESVVVQLMADSVRSIFR